MKYIRTKYGIYEVVREDDEWVDIISNFEKNTEWQCCIKKKGVINQADTIEELCDEFVFDGFNNARGNHDDYRLFKTKSECIRGGCNYYYRMFGAIWTDKGLIYVAKMNEKGELELL